LISVNTSVEKEKERQRPCCFQFGLFCFQLIRTDWYHKLVFSLYGDDGAGEKEKERQRPCCLRRRARGGEGESVG